MIHKRQYDALREIYTPDIEKEFKDNGELKKHTLPDSPFKSKKDYEKFIWLFINEPDCLLIFVDKNKEFGLCDPQNECLVNSDDFKKNVYDRSLENDKYEKMQFRITHKGIYALEQFEQGKNNLSAVRVGIRIGLLALYFTIISGLISGCGWILNLLGWKLILPAIYIMIVVLGFFYFYAIYEDLSKN